MRWKRKIASSPDENRESTGAAKANQQGQKENESEDVSLDGLSADEQQLLRRLIKKAQSENVPASAENNPGFDAEGDILGTDKGDSSA